ncbi:MAG: hypothetical protein V7K76_22935 [Nostoc sp.]|uniref:hypothetical protein n=1 Tax=Nostoc sp. TaxID=1180 RepID=UPI002FF6D067
MTQDYSDINDEKELYQSASPKVQEVIKQVLLAEVDKLYQEKPQIKADIIRILKEVVNENTIDSDV